MSGCKIQVSGLSVNFAGHQALDGVSATFEANQIHLISGPSGSGKSTFLRGLNRLNESLGECHTGGEVEIELQGRPWPVYRLADKELPQLRRRVGMVFQHPRLLPGTVADNLLLPLKLVAGIQGIQAQRLMSDALEHAGLWQEVRDRLHCSAETLSGGQQQRLCLARTLAMQPEVLLLDEPTASLDPRAAAQVEELLLQLKRHYTLLVVSHSPEQVARLADRVLRFEQGRLVE